MSYTKYFWLLYYKMEFQELFKMILFSKGIYLEFLLNILYLKEIWMQPINIREKHFTFCEGQFEKVNRKI